MPPTPSSFRPLVLVAVICRETLAKRAPGVTAGGVNDGDDVRAVVIGGEIPAVSLIVPDCAPRSMSVSRFSVIFCCSCAALYNSICAGFVYLQRGARWR